MFICTTITLIAPNNTVFLPERSKQSGTWHTGFYLISEIAVLELKKKKKEKENIRCSLFLHSHLPQIVGWLMFILCTCVKGAMCERWEDGFGLKHYKSETTLSVEYEETTMSIDISMLNS